MSPKTQTRDISSIIKKGLKSCRSVSDRVLLESCQSVFDKVLPTRIFGHDAIYRVDPSFICIHRVFRELSPPSRPTNLILNSEMGFRAPWESREYRNTMLTYCSMNWPLTNHICRRRDSIVIQLMTLMEAETIIRLKQDILRRMTNRVASNAVRRHRNT